MVWKFFVCSESVGEWHANDPSHDSQKHSQPSNARVGALMAHHLASVDRFTGGCPSTATVHPVLTTVRGLSVARSLRALLR